MYGLAFAYMELADIKQAQKHFQMVLEMEAPEDPRSLAKNGTGWTFSIAYLSLCYIREAP